MPTSLLAHITLTTRGRIRVGAERLVQPGGFDAARRVDRQPDDLGALLGGQPLGGVEDGVVLDPADQQPAAARIGGAPRPEQALDREVVALGPAAGEDHFGRPGVEREGDGLARFLDGAPGAPAARVQRGGVADGARVSITAAIAAGCTGVVAA